MKRWVSAWVWLPVFCVGFASCGDDAAKKTVASSGGEGGGGQEPSSGGSDAPAAMAGVGGSPAPATAGAGGVSEGGTGPVLVTAGAGGEGGQAELMCFQPGPGGNGGVGGDPYAGAQWKDYAANVCQACPAAEVFCDDFVTDSIAAYDPATRELILNLVPGKSEIVAADLLYYYFDGEGYPDVATPATIDGNQLTITLVPEVGDDFVQLDANLAITDGCGDQKELGINGDDWFTLRKLDAPVGGAGGEAPIAYEVYCQND